MMLNKKGLLGIGLLTFSFFIPNAILAENKLAWNSSSGEVNGYRIYYGTIKGNPQNNIDVGDVTEYSLDNIVLQENSIYYFVARAYNSAGESGDSNEVSWRVPDMTAPAPVQEVSVN